MMKVIDLLNKIANDEEVPKIIKVGNRIYNYEEFNIGRGEKYFDAQWEKVKGYRYCYGNTYYYLEIRDYNLNDEVEIIEDNKKIYKLDWVEGNIFNKIQENSYLSRKEIQLLDSNFKELGNKVNEIIDRLNEGDK